MVVIFSVSSDIGVGVVVEGSVFDCTTLFLISCKSSSANMQ